MKKKLIPYGKQTIKKDDVRSVIKTLNSDYLTTGPITNKFENDFKKYVGSKFATSCSSGTAALHLCFLTINLKKNDIVILPVVNFIASVNMAHLLGAKLYFADVDKHNGQMTPHTLEKCIKKYKLKNIKAVITMYNGGNPNNSKLFFKLKKKYKFTLIEDACHALGGSYDKFQHSKVGSCKYSDFATFSLHPLKSITTGEGGMITTNNRKYFEKINIFKNHGIIRKKQKNINNWNYKVISPGYNYRLSEIACNLGISQLKKINMFMKKRKGISNLYKKKLKKYNQFLILPLDKSSSTSANHLFIINLRKNKISITRDKVIQELYKYRIITQVHYIPVFLHPYYKKICKGSFQNAKEYFSSCISLPIFPNLTKREVTYISDCLGKILIKKNKS
tara:strand:+ start:2939 stop:4114 length:1176 start_codon:yes stop_codon:yes gene_type:complete